MEARRFARDKAKKTPARETAKPPISLSPRGLLVVILFVAAFLRFYQLDTAPRGFYRDEAMNGSNALEALETGRFQVFYPENNGREGLFINVAVPFVAWFGNTAWALRLPAALFGVLTVWGVYQFSAELFPVPVSLLAAFFTATSYWHITFSRMSLRANAAGFFLAWSLYLLTAGMKRTRDGRTAVGWMLLSGVVYGLGFHTYIAYRATPALVGGMLVYYFLESRKQEWRMAFGKALLWFGAATVLTVAPLLLYFAGHRGTFFGRTSQVSVFNAPNPFGGVAINIWKTGLMFFVSGDTNWRHNYDGRPELFWPVAILFAVGVIVAIREFKDFRNGVVLGWVAISALPVVFSDDGIPHALRSLLMVPPVMILAAAGAHRVSLWMTPKMPDALRLAAACIFFLALVYEPYHTYFDLWARDPRVAAAFDAGLIDMAEQVNALPRETPKYIAVATGGDLANGIPLSVEPVVYLTKSYTRKQQEASNIHYILPPPGTPAAGFCEAVSARLPTAAVFCVR